MFTGIIEEVGTIDDVHQEGGALLLRVSGPRTAPSLHAGDSIAVNGVCLTVVRRENVSFSVQAVEETLHKTTLGNLVTGTHVNMERPVRLNDPLGGHLVLGHVDTIGRVNRIEELSSSRLFTITFPPEYLKYVIPVGSIAVDGVSMTVASVNKEGVGISVIPHTWENTVFRFRRPGDAVNLEFDVLGKYVERLLGARVSSERDLLGEKHLRELGF